MIKYDRNGEITEKDSPFNCVKSEDPVIYKIPIYDGMPLDPINGMYNERSNSFKDRVLLKKVSEETFENYLKFLKTKNKIFYTIAYRRLIND